MKENLEIKPYDWIILLLASISAIARFIMNKYNFEYVDYFIAIVNLVGLDYIFTTIFQNIKKYIFEEIEVNVFVQIERANKKRRHSFHLLICYLVLVVYNILHLLFFSNSVANDALSMIVLGLSLTDTSVSSFILNKIRI